MTDSVPVLSVAAQCATCLSQLEEADLLEFIEDTIQFLKGYKVPFLSKYAGRFGESSRMVVPTRDYAIDIIQLALRKSASASTLDVFKNTVAEFIQSSFSDEEEIDLKMAEMVAIAIFARREELAKVLTELVFRQSVDSYLLDYNYNVETTIGSDSFAKVNEQLLVLELFLAQNGPLPGQEGSHSDKNVRRVVVELNLEEARTFVGKLKTIEKEIIASSQ